MRSPRTLLLLAVSLALAACGAAPAPPADPPPTAAAAAHGSMPGHAGMAGMGSTDASAPPTLFAVQSGPLGVVVTDGSGRTLYRSDADTADPSASTCTADCTSTWLPLTITDGQEPELLGVDPADVGRMPRADGTTQLTLAGWPLYAFRDDDGTLQDVGRNGADGIWFAVQPTGEKAIVP